MLIRFIALIKCIKEQILHSRHVKNEPLESPVSIYFVVAVVLSNVLCNLLSHYLTQQRNDMSLRILFGLIYFPVLGLRFFMLV